MDNSYFLARAIELDESDIDNIFLNHVAKNHKLLQNLSGPETAAMMILFYEEVYPNSKEGQRKVNIPLRSTFIHRSHTRHVD